MIFKKIRYITATIAVIVSVGTLPTTAYASTVNFNEKKIESNGVKLDTLYDEKSETNTLIAGLNADINKLVLEMSTLTEKIGDSNAKIEKLNGELSVFEDEIVALNQEVKLLRAEIKQTESKIKEKENELTKNQGYLELRVREAYKINPFTQMINVLISSDNLMDFYDRLNFINIMAEEDRKIIDEINTIMAELEVEKEKLENQSDSLDSKLNALISKKEATKKIMTEVSDKKKSLQIEMNQIKEVENNKKVAFSNLSQKEKLIAQEIGDIQTENEALEKEIQQIIREEQRKAEERRLKEEAEAKAKADAQGEKMPSTSQGQNSGYLRPVSGRITSPFGFRLHPIWNVQRFHSGIDYAGGSGTPVKSTKSGTVILSQYKPSYGNLIIVDHGNNVTSLYAHLSSFNVSVGQKVSQGQTLGGVGSTGDSTGPHLHFEIRVNGQPKNPVDYVN